MTSLLEFLAGLPAWTARVEEKIDKIGAIVPTITEALQAWTDYSTSLKQQLADAEAALTDAQNTIQTLQATDAAEDAAQAAQLQDQIAGQIGDALAAVQNPPPPPADATPPADAGSVDTGTGDGSGSADATPPADTSTGDAGAATDTPQVNPLDQAAPPA